MTVICLDLDGTLEDSRADMTAAVLRLRARLGLPPRAAEDFRPHVNQGMDHLYARCFDEHLAEDSRHDPAHDSRHDPAHDSARDPRLAALAAAYTEDYGAHIADETRLYPGIADALAKLADRWPLALVTNKPEALSAALLRALHIDHHFTAIIGGDTLPVAKPHPATLAEAIRRAARTQHAHSAHASAPQPHPPAIMIGDSAGDIRCARDHGVPVIWCAWGYATTPGDHPPDAIAATPADLPALVASLITLGREPHP